MEKNFGQFVEDLKSPSVFNEWGPALALLEIGNLQGLVLFGQTKGYGFSTADVKAFVAQRHESVALESSRRVAPMLDTSEHTNAYLDAWTRALKQS